MIPVNVAEIIMEAVANAPSTGVFIIFVPGKEEEETEGLIDKDDPFALADPFGTTGTGGGSIQDAILMDNPNQ